MVEVRVQGSEGLRFRVQCSEGLGCNVQGSESSGFQVSRLASGFQDVKAGIVYRHNRPNQAAFFTQSPRI